MDVKDDFQAAATSNVAFSPDLPAKGVKPRRSPKTARKKQTSDGPVSNLPVSDHLDFKRSNARPGASDISQDRSPYLVNRLLETSNQNLFNHVKFHLVKQAIDKLQIERPRILDVGCGLQVSRQYLEALKLDFQYFGIDYEARFQPDAIVDLEDLSGLEDTLPWKPDVVLALDVLEHLNEDPEELKKVVSNIRSIVGDDTTLIVTLPQLYRLDRFKLPHLHYPEHKIRLTQSEWREIIEPQFDIKTVQGLGFLSVIPYLPMWSKHYRPDNRLGALFNYLRGSFFEWSPFKPADLFLSNTLGKWKPLKTLSNDILFVASPKK